MERPGRDGLNVSGYYLANPAVSPRAGGDAETEAQFTALEPVGRMGTAAEVGQAVVWLCSDAASFVTGATMPVDGGFVAQ